MEVIKKLSAAAKKRWKHSTSKITIPGGSGISLYTLLIHFQSGITRGRLTTRAASISFTFFLALFPGIIFMFTIIPMIPLNELQPRLMLLLRDLVPDIIYPLLENTIHDIIGRRHTGLLSFGFLMALFFSSSSFISLISSFNQSTNVHETRKPWQQRIVSILLMIGTTLLVLLAISLMILGQDTIEWLIGHQYMKGRFIFSILPAARWFILAMLIYGTISAIYYLAPAKAAGFRFFSVGSLLATLFFLLNAWGFGYFVKYFSAHNALYGSVGTLLLLLLYIYYNAIILLVGFELNASIHAAKRKMQTQTKDSLIRVV
jgi:membrane protein